MTFKHQPGSRSSLTDRAAILRTFKKMMNRSLLLAIIVLTSSVPSFASFSISEISGWEQMKERGLDFQFHLVGSNDGQLEYYSFTLQAPVVDEKLPGKILTRVDYWKDERSTVIPIHLQETGAGMRMASFQISTVDLEKVSLVLRFNEPDSSSEVGWRLHLKKLIDAKPSNKPE